MKSVFIRRCLFSAAMCYGGSVFAVPVNLSAAIDAAWQRAVSAQQSRGLIEQAQSAQGMAQRYWAKSPALDASYKNGAGRETELGLVWALWLPSQRASSQNVAEAMTKQAQYAQQVARLDIAGQVRDAGWQYLLADTDRLASENILANLRQLASDVERRVAADDLARTDSLLAQAEVLSALSQRDEMVQRVQQAQRNWQTLTGLAELPDVATFAELSRPVDTHPQILLAQASSAYAQQQLTLARLTKRDAPELKLGWQQNEEKQNTLILGVRVPLFEHERAQPQEVAALSELAQQTTAEQRLRERVENDAMIARSAVQLAEQQLKHETDKASVLRERANLLQRSFDFGQTSLSDLLRALSLANQSERAQAKQQRELGWARAKLQQVLGDMQ